MKVVLTSVMVDDQEKALRFYHDILGFQPKVDIPMGEHRWLTLVSPGDSDGVQLVLEPDGYPAAKPFKAALVADGIPATSFGVEDVRVEHERLSALGVAFMQPPVAMGPVRTAVFDGTCGNLIQIAQQHWGHGRERQRAERQRAPFQASKIGETVPFKQIRRAHSTFSVHASSSANA